LNDILTVLAQNIKFYRSQLGLTQEDLAKRAEINRSYLAGIETGQRNTSVKTIEKLAQALEISPADLLKSLDLPPNE
jgi:transcriptional regulator with XRE-family HTH domain